MGLELRDNKLLTDTYSHSYFSKELKVVTTFKKSCPGELQTEQEDI
jgi:hypothetical protein